MARLPHRMNHRLVPSYKGGEKFPHLPVRAGFNIVHEFAHGMRVCPCFCRISCFFCYL